MEILAWEVHRGLDVTQKTAWLMLLRIRLAMQDDETGGTLGGPIEVDEALIGGQLRKMHKHVRARKITGTGGKDKTAIMGILQRGGKVRTKVVADRKKALLQAIVKAHVEPGAAVYTHILTSHEGLDGAYLHPQAIGVENFWSRLKRTPASGSRTKN